MLPAILDYNITSLRDVLYGAKAAQTLLHDTVVLPFDVNSFCSNYRVIFYSYLHVLLKIKILCDHTCDVSAYPWVSKMVDNVLVTIEISRQLNNRREKGNTLLNMILKIFVANIF